MRTNLPIAVLGALLLLSASGAAQPFCAKCRNTGLIENPLAVKQRKELAEYGLLDEPNLRVSAYVDDDRKGASLPSLPCEGCRAPEQTAAAREQLKQQHAAMIAWREERAQIETLVKPRDELVFVDTEHFRLVFGLRKVTLASKKVLDTRRAALLYAQRLEQFHDWFQARLGYDDGKARVTRHDIYLMGDLRTLQTVAHRYCNLPTDRAARAVGDPSILTTWPETGVYNRDADFHRHVLYHVSHLLLGVYHLKVWLVEYAGWLEEGIAHVGEMELFTLAGNTSSQERPDDDRADADWEPLVRELIARNRTISFAELMRKRADQLSTIEHQLAWSYTDFLFKVHGHDVVRGLVEDLKEARDPNRLRDSLRDRCNLTVTGIDEVWQAWVLQNYRQKP